MESSKKENLSIAEINHYEDIAANNQEASEILSDYFFDQASYHDFKNEELNKKALKYSQYAATGDPAGYCYRTGWMLSEGIGCNPSFRLARKYLEDAYFTGNWEGAALLSLMFRQRAESENLPQKEREYCLKEAASWHKSAEELHLKNIAEEPDFAIEED